MKANHEPGLIVNNFRAACIRVMPGLNEVDFELITPNLLLKSCRKGEVISRENDICDKIYFLDKGFVRMYYVDFHGNEINYRFTETNNFFLDFQSFLTKKPSRFNWKAMEDVDVITINYQNVQSVYETSNNWNFFGRLMAEQVYLQLNERVEMLLFMQPEERYLHMLSKHPTIINKVPQLHIASYLGIKPETLSRIRKRIVNN